MHATQEAIQQSSSPQSDSVQPRLLTVKQSAAYLGVKPSLIRSLKYAHAIPFVQPHKHLVLFDKADLDAWVEKNKTAVGSA